MAYNITDAEISAWLSGKPHKLRITMTNGGVTTNITEDDVLQGTFVCNRYVLDGKRIGFGSTIAAELDFTLDNSNGDFSATEFKGSELYVEVGVDVSGTVMYIPLGYYDIITAPRVLDAIDIVAYDRLVRFGKYVDFSGWQSGQTVGSIIQECCITCGVAFSGTISSLLHYDYTVDVFPDDDDPTTDLRERSLTYAQLIGWCAEITGNVAYMGRDGELHFGWFDVTTPTDYDVTLDTETRYQSSVADGDFVANGVVIYDGQTRYVSGTEEEAIWINYNQLIQHDESEIASDIFDIVEGFQYRPFTAQCLPMPWIDTLDAVEFETADGDLYKTICTDWTFALNGATAIAAKGETSAEESALGMAASMSAAAAMNNAEYAVRRAVLQVDKINNKITAVVKDVDSNGEAITELESQVQQNADGISQIVERGGAGTAFRVEADGVNIYGSQNGEIQNDNYIHFGMDEDDSPEQVFVAGGTEAMRLNQGGIEVPNGIVSAAKGLETNGWRWVGGTNSGGERTLTLVQI